MLGRSVLSAPVPDRIVTTLADRRATILEVIRNARSTIALSLFRCNDEEIFAEIARADRARRGRRRAGHRAGQRRPKEAREAVHGVETDRREYQHLQRSRGEIPREIPRGRRRAGGGGLVELHAQVFHADAGRAGRHLGPRRREPAFGS